MKLYFFYGYKYKNVVEYKILFLDEKKSFFPYLVRFFDNLFVLLKKYLDYCIINSFDYILIIIIINNKNYFFGNNAF